MKLIMKYQKRDIFLQKKDKRLFMNINEIPKNSKFDRQHVKSAI